MLTTIPTITTLSTSASALAAGQQLTLTATVADTPGNPTPTGGTVTFKDNATVLGTATLADGTATLQTTALAVGAHSLTAVYGGAGQFAGGASGLSPTSTIATVAGTGAQGYSGDGGDATKASFYTPYGLTVDAAGNVYIVDHGNNVIRELTTDGKIATIAGNGTQGYLGDNGAATSAELNGPGGIAVDSSGNIFIADQYNNVIREVSGGIITTIAGNGSQGNGGDGGAAIAADLNQPEGMAFDAAGNLYIAEHGGSDVRKITAQDGKITAQSVITTVAGTVVNGQAQAGYGGDGGAATAALLSHPTNVAVDAAGNLFIADFENSAIREVTAADGKIHTIAGNGTAGYGGDNQAATGSELNFPEGLAFDNAGNLFISDYHNSVIREITTDGIIHTVVGNSQAGDTGDGGPATRAMINNAYGVAINSEGDIYISELVSNRVREIKANLPVTVVPGPVTHFVVAGAPGGVAGAAESFTVTAYDAYGNVATNYAGTVHFASSDPNATLPADIALDGGTGTFSFTPRRAGSLSLTATDATAAGVIGTETDIAVTHAAEAGLTLTSPGAQQAGVVATYTVTAVDAYGNVVTDDDETATITASDPQALAPATVTLSGGTARFAVTPRTAGEQSVTVAGRANPDLAATASGVVAAGSVARLALAGSTSTVAGASLPLTVTAYDAYGNVVTTATDLVHFTSDDPQAVLPADANLIDGVATLAATLKTAGTHTLMAQDSTSAGLSATVAPLVTAAAVARLGLTGGTSVVVGTATTLTLTAYDAYGNVVTTATDTIHLASSDAAATVPATVTLAAGTATFPVIFATAGTQSVTATDAQAEGVTGSSPGIAVEAVIRGTIYRDLNANGARDAGEPGMPGRVVYLDLNGNGVLDAAEPTATTDAAGQFSFAGHAAGTAPVLEATDHDLTDRYAIAQASTDADGSVLVGIVPYSPVAPVTVATATATAASSATTPDLGFVESLYRSVLGRAGGALEVQGWMSRLGAGTTPDQVAAGFINSPEHRQDEVVAFYREFLHRATDPSAAHWVDELMAGVSEQRVVESILDAPEYQSAHADSAALVRDLYADVLGRAGDPAGMSRWADLMAAGMTRAQVVANFVESAEAVDQIIDSDYAAFLHRQPDPSSVYWRTMIRTNAGSPAVVAARILASSEYLELNARAQA